MILKDRIEESLIPTIKYNYKGIPLKYNYLPEEALEEITQEVIECFKSKGWDTKQVGRKNHDHRYISRRSKHHTKIEWEIYAFNKSHHGWRVRLRALTPHKGWRTHKHDRKGDILELIEIAEAIPAPKLISKDSLPESRKFEFKDNFIVHRNLIRSEKAVLNAVAFKKVIPGGAVGLEKDGSITQKIITNPNEQVWIHLICVGQNGEKCDLITDGERYLPLKSTGKKRVTDKQPAILNRLTKLDQELINAAINLLFRPEESD